jgi:hypothetical protein
MKMIIAVIQPDKLTDVKDALMAANVGKMTALNVIGCGQQMGYHESYRGADGGEPPEEGGAADRGERRLREADGGCDHQGRAHREHRRREDLRPRPARVHPHPDGRDRGRPPSDNAGAEASNGRRVAEARPAAGADGGAEEGGGEEPGPGPAAARQPFTVEQQQGQGKGEACGQAGRRGKGVQVEVDVLIFDGDHGMPERHGGNGRAGNGDG